MLGCDVINSTSLGCWPSPGHFLACSSLLELYVYNKHFVFILYQSAGIIAAKSQILQVYNGVTIESSARICFDDSVRKP